MRIYNKFCQQLSNVIMAFCCLLVCVMLVSSFLQVFSRYVLGNSFMWTEETARYCFIWMDMLGSALLVYKGGHAVVDIFSNKIAKGTFGKFYKSLLYIATGYVGGIFAIYGVKLSQVTWRQKSPSLKLPMGFVYGVLIVAGILIMFFVLNLVLNLWLTKPEKDIEEKGE